MLRVNTKAEGKLLSIFETHTEVIRKGKAHKPNEKTGPDSGGGELVIVTHYQVCEQRAADLHCWEDVWSNMSNSSDAPRSVAADPGFFSANESKAGEMGVSRSLDSKPRHEESRTQTAAEAALV